MGKGRRCGALSLSTAKMEELIDELKDDHEAETIYLVGDTQSGEQTMSELSRHREDERVERPRFLQ